ncbi:MAG: cobalt-precorrin-5B (C(1))-methyltransferase CbiD, partial [Actinomycetota bacterium]|nr:cobalt-precorrin-5B (C(1))-methyltransferase CbiD [Actinomycetota bacterium]
AAAKAAAAAFFSSKEGVEQIEIPSPNGERLALPIFSVAPNSRGAQAIVIKDAGDDPDVTDGAPIHVLIEPMAKGEIIFTAGEGVGTVTKEGLLIPVGEPAINPVPREMISAALKEVIEMSLQVTISIPRGEEISKKTYNPRLGIVGGLSILGSSGRVRPFSTEAIRCSILCALNIASAAFIKTPVFVAGRIGERSAKSNFNLKEDQIIEVGNEWGFVLEGLGTCGFEEILILGHPGKLVKLAVGEWNTHSAQSISPLRALEKIEGIFKTLEPSNYLTLEGFFGALNAGDRSFLAGEMSRAIADSVEKKREGRAKINVVLTDMKGQIMGSYGDLTPWQ